MPPPVECPKILVQETSMHEGTRGPYDPFVAQGPAFLGSPTALSTSGGHKASAADNSCCSGPAAVVTAST